MFKHAKPCTNSNNQSIVYLCINRHTFIRNWISPIINALSTRSLTFNLTSQYSNVEPPQPIPYEQTPNKQYSQVDNNQSMSYPNPPSVNEGKSISDNRYTSSISSVNEGNSISDDRYTSSIPSDNSIEKSQVDQNTYKEN